MHRFKVPLVFRINDKTNLAVYTSNEQEKDHRNRRLSSKAPDSTAGHVPRSVTRSDDNAPSTKSHP